MNKYLVTWAIEVDADTAIEAAEKASEIHKDPNSIATVFHVTNVDTRIETRVDLLGGTEVPVMNQARAIEIVDRAKAKAVYGSWVDQLGTVMTHEEKRQINRHWDTMSGSSSFYDALMQFVNGRVLT